MFKNRLKNDGLLKTTIVSQLPKKPNTEKNN